MKKLFYISTIFYALLVASILTNAQGVWTQKASYNGNVRQQAIGFSIGNYGYLGLGYEAFSFATDFEKYDPSSNSWVSIANFPGGTRWGTTAFSIGNYGYISTGFRGSPPIYYSDLWRYDPATNSWTAKANFPGGGRWYGVGFSIGNKGYVGLGYNSLTGTSYSDIWEYDPATDSWTPKANFPGIRNLASSFTIANKAYIVCGDDATSITNDLWEFDPAANTWTLKSSYPGNPRHGLVSFAINNFGYAGAGQDNFAFLTTDFYKYDPSTDTWTPITFFSGSARWMAVGFNIGNKGYLGTGSTGCPSPGCDLNDFWEYSLLSVGICESNKINSITVYPNPFSTQTTFQVGDVIHNATLTIDNCFGQIVTQIKNINEQIIVLHRGNLSSGLYFAKLTQDDKVIATKKLIVID